jgi:suppressor for copper-sensitivity B
MKQLIYLIVASILLYVTNVQASPVVVTPQAQIQLVAGSYQKNQLLLGVDFQLEPGWKIYWRTPGDVGFPPQYDFSKSSNIADIDWQWPVPKREVEKITDSYIAESYIYKERVVFPVLIEVKDPQVETVVSLQMDYAICKDICIPAQSSLQGTYIPGLYNQDGQSVIQGFQRFVPSLFSAGIANVAKAYRVSENEVAIELNHANRLGKDVDMFVESKAEVVYSNPKVNRSETTTLFTYPIIFLTEDKTLSPIKLTLSDGAFVQEFDVDTIDPLDIQHNQSATLKSEEGRLLVILLMALLGGLILNFMPCVLPVLSIKILGVLKQSSTKGSVIRLSFISAALGIIVSFILLSAGVLWLQALGKQVGWGFHFQEPLFIIFLIFILSFFAMNVWGWFPIRLPFQLGGGEGTGGLRSHFFSGMLATLLATPCTAPFVGTAVGFALTQGGYHVVTIFTFMGVGMALPYILLAVFPSCFKYFPQAGKWMIVFKNVMGWLLTITALWLIWVLSSQLGYLAAISVLCLVILKWFNVRFLGHENTLPRLMCILIVVLGFALPIQVAEQPDKVDIGEIWQPLEPQKIQQYVEQGKIVFVDITADWCLTCKVNKWTTLQRAEILELLSEDNVIAMQADWTNKNDEITAFLKENKRSGIPFNSVYGKKNPEGVVLPELLSVRLVRESVENAR